MTEDFDQFYGQIYGARWPLLKAALLQNPPKTARNCFNGHATYTLDEASIVAALALPMNQGDLVLDMCAAPGGKALILAEELFKDGKGGELIANELSFSRRKRLEEVVRAHVPEEFASKIQITSWDAEKIGIRGPGRFDKILLDAPCSSERHLLHQNEEMSDWKVSRTKQLSKRQYSLLCSALLALKPGGVVLYSTCSISPLENDGVIERILDRKADQVEIFEIPVSSFSVERTKYGNQIFPDVADGAGPIYFSALKKKN